jgi:hypothetical protein
MPSVVRYVRARPATAIGCGAPLDWYDYIRQTHGAILRATQVAQRSWAWQLDVNDSVTVCRHDDCSSVLQNAVAKCTYLCSC